MSEVATVILTDDTPVTPVNRSFLPVKRGTMANGNSQAAWENRAGGIALGYDSLAATFARPDRNRKVFRSMFLLRTPILETLSNSTVTGYPPAPTESYFNMIRVESFIAERASEQSRKDLHAMFLDLVGEAMYRSVVRDNDFPY